MLDELLSTNRSFSHYVNFESNVARLKDALGQNLPLCEVYRVMQCDEMYFKSAKKSIFKVSSTRFDVKLSTK